MMSHFRELYRSEQLPVFQNRMFASAQEACDCIKGNMLLVQDMRTGLIFNKAFQPELLQYDEHYQNEQAVSGVFREHLERVALIINKHFHDQNLIEVGCGKGYFLEHLEGLGFKITGLDPTYEGDNPSILKKYFTPELGLHADAIILRHVLEHVKKPMAFLAQLCESNGGKGKIYIEVPCFDWICEQRAWFDIFYEHVNYFRLGDFNRIFAQVYESGHTFAGQYLYVVADLASFQQPKDLNIEKFNFPEDFLDGIELYSQNLLKQGPSAIWGGASKGVIFSLFMQRLGANIDFVIDINPAKQGKYLAASGLRVCSPEEALQHLAPGSDIYVMNSNYLDEIARMTEQKFNLIAIDN
jgi:hypothetical protein